MRRLLLKLFFILCIRVGAQDINDLFNRDSLVFYGFDFSAASLVGDFGNGSGADMRDLMFAQWNELIDAERNKFNIARAFRKRLVSYDLAPVRQSNAKADDKRILAPAPPAPFTVSKIQNMVSSYKNGSNKEGVAVVFIVESLDKNEQRASVYATVFDIKSRTVLLTQLIRGTPGGYGLKHYWAKAFRSIIEQINTLNYNEWKKKYRTRK